MKKIILLVLMVFASVNLFSNEELDDIDDTYYYFYKSSLFFEKVTEDVMHNDNIIELDNGYSLGRFDDVSFGHFIYKIKVTNDNGHQRITSVILNNEYTYNIFRFQTKSESGLLLTFFYVRIFDKEDMYVYEGSCYLEDDNIIYDSHYNYITFTYYSNVNN